MICENGADIQTTDFMMLFSIEAGYLLIIIKKKLETPFNTK